MSRAVSELKDPLAENDILKREHTIVDYGSMPESNHDLAVERARAAKSDEAKSDRLLFLASAAFLGTAIVGGHFNQQQHHNQKAQPTTPAKEMHDSRVGISEHPLQGKLKVSRSEYKSTVTS